MKAIKLFLLGLAMITISPVLATGNPIQLPRGVFMERHGELRLVIARDNTIFIQEGTGNDIHGFHLKVVAQTRSEFWCEVNRYSSGKASGDLHPVFKNLKPGGIYKTVDAVIGRAGTKTNSLNTKKDAHKKTQTIVLGNVEALPEQPMRPPLPELQKNMRFIFTFTGNKLEFIVFGHGLDGQIIHLNRVR